MMVFCVCGQRVLCLNLGRVLERGGDETRNKAKLVSNYFRYIKTSTRVERESQPKEPPNQNMEGLRLLTDSGATLRVAVRDSATTELLATTAATSTVGVSAATAAATAVVRGRKQRQQP